jgi:hypothetical protein
MNEAYILERIEKTKALIVLWEDALSALASGAYSYTIDTGQTRQTVTKQTVSQAEAVLSKLENRLDVLYARLNGGSVIAN